MNKNLVAAAFVGLFAANATAFNLVGVESPRQHGAHICSINLSLDANNPTVEPRGGQAMLVFSYDKAVDDSAFNYPQATAIPSGYPAATVTNVDGKEVTVMVSGTFNQTYVTIQLETYEKGTNNFNASAVTVGYLLGDVNQTRVVTVADKGLANADIGRPLNCNQGNRRFRYDVNADGAIDLQDTSIINAQITRALPAR